MKHKRKWVFWLRWPLFMACSVGTLLLGSHVVKFFHKFIVPYYHYPYKPVFLSVMISVQIMVLTMIFSAWAIDVLLHKIAMDEIVEPEAKKRENRLILKYEIIRYLIAVLLAILWGGAMDLLSIYPEYIGVSIGLILLIIVSYFMQYAHKKGRKKLLKAIKEMRLAEKQNTQTH